MLKYKDIVSQNLKVLNTKEVSIINNEDEDYIYAALTVEGGAVIKKGISIGLQDKMVPGLMIYDNENFYGFSEKHGLLLMSNNNEYNQLEFPLAIFNDSVNEKLYPTKTTNKMDNYENIKNSEIVNKNLNIDLQVKDSSFFYLTIPEQYITVKYTITFDINYIYDMSSVVSHLSFNIINETDKSLFFNIVNKNCYYESSFSNEIKKKSVVQINSNFVNENCILITSNNYKQF